MVRGSPGEEASPPTRRSTHLLYAFLSPPGCPSADRCGSSIRGGSARSSLPQCVGQLVLYGHGAGASVTNGGRKCLTPPSPTGPGSILLERGGGMSRAERDTSPAPRRSGDPRSRRKEREKALRREDRRRGMWFADPIDALIELAQRLWMRRDDRKARRRSADRVEARRRKRERDGL